MNQFLCFWFKVGGDTPFTTPPPKPSTGPDTRYMEVSVQLYSGVSSRARARSYVPRFLLTFLEFTAAGGFAKRADKKTGNAEQNGSGTICAVEIRYARRTRCFLYHRLQSAL